MSDDNPDDTTTLGQVAVNSYTVGTIETDGDHDWFRAYLFAGHNYIINERGFSSFKGNLQDPFVALHNPSGLLRASDDNSGPGPDAQLAVHVSATSTYFIDAASSPSALIQTGTYTVDIQDVGTSALRFEPSHASLAEFTPGSSNWTSQDAFPRYLARMNPDDMADIVGFGQGGVYLARAEGGGNFFGPSFALAAFAPDAGGWTSDNKYHRELADVNGSGIASIVGFGEGGVQVAINNGNGTFSAPFAPLAAFAPGAGGWTSQDLYPRHLADVNGDNKADIVGFGQSDVEVALATGGGNFAAPMSVLNAFAPGAGGWSSDNTYHRELADVNGDHMADIVGFGQGGVMVSLATGGGGFAAPTFELAAFAPGAGGWMSEDAYPRHLADVNADGKADIVGFGQGGVMVSLATGGGHFAAPTFELDNFNAGAGWTSDNIYHRTLADVTGDGRADIVGFGANSVLTSAAHDYVLI